MINDSVQDQQCSGRKQHTQHRHSHTNRDAALLELPHDEGGNHQCIRRSDQAGRHQLPECDDKGHHPAGGDALPDQRKGDTPQDISRASAEHLSCRHQAITDLGKRRGDILHRIGQKQHHIGQNHDAHGVVQRQDVVDLVPE